jgi:5-methylcytosine-specific restriction endonuclease McrA
MRLPALLLAVLTVAGTAAPARARSRDHHGSVLRDPAQRRAFQRHHPCPSTGRTYGACPGYVVDHIKPLKRGGADRPSNMQWQTTAEAKAKDKWE